MDAQQKHDIYIKHFLQKPCKICHIDNSQKFQFIFCDRCDDGYHWHCLIPPITKQLAQDIDQWRCPQCIVDQRQFSQSQSYGQDGNKIYSCHKCHNKINGDIQYKMQILAIDSQGNREAKLTNTNYITKKKCRFCKNIFHAQCFSHRNNCVNCWGCQLKIRAECPKNHTKFVEYLKNDLNKIKQSGFLQLDILRGNQNLQESRNLINLQLQVFDVAMHWQKICRIQSSLFYALKTSNVYYCRSQLYENQEKMKLNQSRFNIISPSSLHESDQKIYEQFRILTAFYYIPPIQIKQDYLKGFYVTAVQFIPQRSLICQYTGQVCTKRESNQKHIHNDSVMSLIYTQQADTGLDIAPQKFSNMSRFISGVPPNRKDLQNVTTLNFSYHGRSHIIFYTIKNIEKDEILYIDYNKGIFEEYPNEHFVA